MRHIWFRVGIVAGVAVLVAAVSLVGYGYVWGFDNPSATAGTSGTLATTTTVASTSSTTLAPTTTSTVAPTTTTTHPRMANPAPLAMPPVPPNGLGQGSSGPTVLAFEQRLASLHFDPGPVDGRFDLATRYAVETVQKLWTLPRTGRIDDSTRFVISHFKYPTPAVSDGPATRVEIDLNKQVLVVWQDWQVRLMTTTSTGSGRYFCGGDAGCQYAITPAGRFHFQRYHSGWDHGKLGDLWNPYYFNGGIAVHGYSSVPVYNASHGCSRIPMHIANYFATLVSHGEEVDVVGTPAGPPPGTPLPTNPPPVSTTTTSVPVTVPKTTTTHTATTHPTTTTTQPVTTTTH